MVKSALYGFYKIVNIFPQIIDTSFSEANSCSSCPAGTFTSVPNDETSCELCPRGKSSKAGSTSCDLTTVKMPDGCKGKGSSDRSCDSRKAVDEWISGWTLDNKVDLNKNTGEIVSFSPMT